MSSEWAWKRLGDHCSKIGSGATPKGGKDSYLDSGPFTLIRSQNIYNDGFSPGGLAFISDKQAKKLDGVAIEVNDILLNITGDSVARVCLAPAKYLPSRVNQHVAIIRPEPATFDSRFVRYFLASPIQQDFMLGLASAGATRNALTKVMIEDFKVPCPPLNLQSEIADVLSALDDRIAILCETNATLEAIAQAMFKSWFVDFDPVHAKQQGCAPEGIDEATAALFPDSFEESELGLVPRGWKVGKLADFAKQHKGSINPLQNPETLYEHFSLPAFDSQHMPVLELGTEIKSNKTSVPPDAVLLSKLNPHIPRIWLPVDVGSNAVCSTEFLVFVPAGGASKEFIYCAFTTPKFKELLCQLVTGTSNSHQRVKPDGVSSMSAVLPPLEVLGVFADVVKPMFERIGHNLGKAQTLATLRDTLLPRLISGQLRLPEAEELLEEIA